ncbi:hypothetical protein AB1207_24095 [Kineococcus endophyticus]|uniref:DUF4365 domain-containing protein n=1 Tax=Kineococcus endophyticus TaxID=1181883 RepID=A0ABV3PEN8_9ACTN
MADNKMLKTAGEHWVASTLALHGWAPALTRDGIERTDILAVHVAEARTAIEVQVKTSSDGRNVDGGRGVFMLGRKGLLPSQSLHEWFVLVVLARPTPERPAPEPPAAYVVPRDHASAGFWIVHQRWLTDPSVPAGRRNTPATHGRVTADVFASYRDRWDLLSVPTPEVPVLLPEWVQAAQRDQRFGLPPGHPWHTAA